MPTLAGLALDHPDGHTYSPFASPIEELTGADVKQWLVQSPRASKTKANYHGVLYQLLQQAVEHDVISKNPCARTAPSRKKIRAEQGENVYLTEKEFGDFLE